MIQAYPALYSIAISALFSIAVILFMASIAELLKQESSWWTRENTTLSRGLSRGHGSCGICGGSWEVKKPHYLPMPNASAIFPYCEECHRTKSKKEKHAAIDRLKQKWENMLPLTKDELSKIEEAHRIVEAAE